MKKLFISQPMRNKTDEQILKERELAIQKAKEILSEDVEVIDSFFQDREEPADVKRSGVYWLGKSLELLATADVAYFALGWEKARCCIIENQCAREYDIMMIE